MHKIKYSSLHAEAKKYWEWSQATPVPKVPDAVAREGAGSELRTPLMHYGVILPVYMAIARYLESIGTKKGMRLIELGSGSGRPLAYLKTLFPELEVWGVDYSKSGITYAKKVYGKTGVTFKHVKAQDTSLQNESFDFVISSHVIEHVTKEEGFRFIEEANRLVKKGGYVFIGTPERRNCQNLYHKNPTDDKRFRLVPPHEHEYTLPELKKLGQTVFSEKNVRVDALINPTFMKIFKSSIDKFKPNSVLKKHTVNLAYRVVRDKASRPFFDTLTRVGVKQQMLIAKTSFQKILLDNSIAASGREIPANLLLVCKK